MFGAAVTLRISNIRRVNRIANIGLAVLAVVVFASAIYVITHNDAPRGATTGSVAAHETPALSIVPSTPSLGVDASSAVATGTSGQPSSEPVVAFLGDDWTAGIGATREAKRFTTLVSTALNVQELNFGVDGTGYAKSSAAGGSYRSRIDEIAAANPQVVVVSGGRNDSSDDADTLAAHAEELFAKLREKLPNTVLVAVAPFWGDSDLPPELVALGTAIEKGVTDVGGTYLDIEDPIHNHPEFMADLADPNNKGYAAIAEALAPQLEPLLPR